MAAEQRSTKQELVYRALRERIADGRYGPGYRIVVDSVAEELGVSSLPVREAIRRLEAERLVVQRPNVGARVAQLDLELLEGELTVVAVLDGYATAAAAPHLGATEIRRLRRLTDGMARAMESMDPLTFGRLDDEFHALLHERSRNPALVELIRGTELKLRAIRPQLKHRAGASVSEHRRIVELIESSASATRIERAARAHRLATVESFRAWQRARPGAE